MVDSKANTAVSYEALPDLLKNTPSNIARSEDVIEHSKANAAVSDEALPDLLKNTPSNIVRLEDEIEHSKANTAVSDEALPDLLKNTPSNIVRLEDEIEHSKANTAVSDEALLDLLKNTPSNIARLEDVIEHCKGRHKYLAHTKSASDGGDVRWYFCQMPLAVGELAASVPCTEIVGKSDYFRFGIRDSLAIEASFLQREEELLSCWWKEFAECSEGPRGQPSSSKRLDAQKIAHAPDGARAGQICESEEERVGVPVKGGLYEVDLVKRHCFPVYWNGENRRVLRGHWFARKGGLDWLPLREDVAEQLEIAYRSQVWHRRTFQSSGLFAARVDLQGSTMGLHALFTGEDDTWEAWLNVDASGLSGIVSITRNGIKLRRGYSASQSVKPTQDELRQQQEEEMDDYCSQVPVCHLVFMVHGIGQRLEKSNLVDDVAQFRHITASLAERHLTPHQLGSQRVLFIPCQWRKGLKLSGEAAVEKITLDGVRGLRVALSATVHDVLYYMSPIYCQDIIDSVSNQLNRLYLKFLKRNPGYDGKVSLYGHSLGSVLSYDILCHQENLSSPFPMDWMYHDQHRDKESSLDTNNRSPTCDSSISPVQLSSDIVHGAKDDMDDQAFMNAHPVNDDTDARKFSTVLSSSVSNSDEVFGIAAHSRQNNDQTVGHESVYDSIDLLSQEGAHLCDPSGTEFDDSIGILENKERGGCMVMSDKDEEINLLREEIDSLKAKIAQLESKCGSGDVHSRMQQEKREEVESVPKLHIPEGPSCVVDDARKSYTPYIKYTKLEFKVDTFFAVGSPLGVFLALRNIRIGIGNGKEYWEEENISEEMPACRQMFNIFHPYDPVAYRVEPFVCKDYITKRPVIIPYHRGGRRLHIGFQEFTEDLAARSQAVMHRIRRVKVKVLTICQPRNVDAVEEGEENGQEKEERTYGSIMMETLTRGGGRIDHMLQDKTFEHTYLQAIGAHTNYWRDYDTALFILKHLYRDTPEDGNSLKDSSQGTSKDEISSSGWSNRREIAEEELPLTFSDSMMVRNFSRKAKRFVPKTLS